MAKTRAQRKAERRAREAEQQKRTGSERRAESRAQHDTQVGVSGDVAEIEAVLLDHPAVAECGVVAAPDESRGFIVKAYIVPRPGFVPGQELVKELQDYVKAEVAPYKYPRAIEFLESLPRTDTGKLQRFRLREMNQ